MLVRKFLAGTAFVRMADAGGGGGGAAGAEGGGAEGGDGGAAAPGPGSAAGEVKKEGAAPAAAAAPDPYAAWGDGLDDDTRGVIERKHWKGPADAARAYRGLEELVGKDVLPPPDPEKLDQWPGWKALGVPDKPEGYGEIEQPKLADGVTWDNELQTAVLAAGPNLKLTPGQVKGLTGVMAEHMNKRAANAQAEIDAAMASTRQDFMRRHGKEADAKLAGAQRAVEHFEAGEQVLALLDAKMGSGAVMDFFARLGDAIGEDGGLVTGGVKPPAGKVTQEQAKAQLAAKKADKAWNDALNNADDPGHKAAAEEFRQYNRIIKGLDPNA